MICFYIFFLLKGSKPWNLGLKEKYILSSLQNRKDIDLLNQKNTFEIMEKKNPNKQEV